MPLRSSEKKGIIVLSFLLTGFFVFPLLIEEDDTPFFLLTQAEIPDSMVQFSTHPASPVKRFELNSVDSVSLTKIKGIGPYYASKILKYRKRLGGFHTPLQLKEISFKYLSVDSLLDHFYADPKHITKKEMDTMSFKSILSHPYLEYGEVQLIFKAKKEWGIITYSLLEQKKILAPHKLKKIKPYFK